MFLKREQSLVSAKPNNVVLFSRLPINANPAVHFFLMTIKIAK